MKGHFKKLGQAKCGQSIQGTDDFLTDHHELVDCKNCIVGLTLSVVGVIYNENYDVLVVSRKDDSTKWNLPGGKVEPEDFQPSQVYPFLGLRTAIAREVLEETGLSFPPDEFHIVYGSVVGSYYSTFMQGGPISSEGNRLVAEEGTQAKWMRLKDLLEVCPFKDGLVRAIEYEVFDARALL